MRKYRIKSLFDSEEENKKKEQLVTLKAFMLYQKKSFEKTKKYFVPRKVAFQRYIKFNILNRIRNLHCANLLHS